MSARTTLRLRLETHDAVIGIVGLGYVGLPLALAFAEAGRRVLGLDTDPRKVAALERGETYITQFPASRIAAARATGRLHATTETSRLAECDVIVICVPTPLTPQREPDLGAVIATTNAIAATLRPGQLVVLESTTWPGTTDEVLRPRLEAGGLVCGRDFFLAFSPEREDPGNPNWGTTTIPKLVGGVDQVSGDLAVALYTGVVREIVQVPSARVAEAAKITENVYRSVNIALVNELKLIYDRMGIDVWDVLDAAATKPFGFQRFDPGPGLGGHCIPIDPFYLAWKAREHGLAARFVELAGEINVAMPGYVVRRIQDALNDSGKPVRGSRVLVLGIAYKRNVADPRESPAFEILEGLLHLGANVTYHDPHIPVAPPMRSWPDLPALQSTELTTEDLAASDVVVVVTDHQAIDWQLVATHAPLVVDTRGVFRHRAVAGRLVLA